MGHANYTLRKPLKTERERAEEKGDLAIEPIEIGLGAERRVEGQMWISGGASYSRGPSSLPTSGNSALISLGEPFHSSFWLSAGRDRSPGSSQPVSILRV